MPGSGRSATWRLALLAVLLLCASPHGHAAPAASPATIEGATLTVLIRDTLAALDQANRTGNYTVLRDLGTETFRKANDAAGLAAVFTPFREAGVAMTPALVASPGLTHNPMRDKKGRLHLVGHVSAGTRAIRYRLIFEHAGQDWRLAGLAVKFDPETDPAMLAATARELRRGH